jgi:hypothetical protein
MVSSSENEIGQRDAGRQHARDHNVIGRRIGDGRIHTIVRDQQACERSRHRRAHIDAIETVLEADDHVVVAVRSHTEHIIAGAAVQRIVTKAAIERVIAVVTIQQVVADAAEQPSSVSLPPRP